MAPVNRRIVKKKTSRRKAKKRGGRGPVPGTLYTRRKVGPETVSFVKGCFFSRYRKSRGWGFLKSEERENLNTIAIALIKHQIVTGTMKAVVINALVELDFLGVIELPPPLTRGRRKQQPES